MNHKLILKSWVIIRKNKNLNLIESLNQNGKWSKDEIFKSELLMNRRFEERINETGSKILEWVGDE